MNAEMMLACPPVDKEALEKIGIIHLDIGPNYVKGRCTECKCEVWIGLKQKDLLEAMPDMPVHCFVCAKNEIKKRGAGAMGAVIPMGPGGGAKYIMKGGKIHAEGKD